MKNRKLLTSIAILTTSLLSGCMSSNVGIAGKIPFTPPTDLRPAPLDTSYTANVTTEHTTTLLSIFFDNKSTTVKNADNTINTVATILNDHPEAKIKVVGYASGYGAKTNKNIAITRANNISQLLVKKGVDLSNIQVTTNTSSKQSFNNDQQNQRVDIFFLTPVPGYTLIKNKVPAIVNDSQNLDVVNTDDN